MTPYSRIMEGEIPGLPEDVELMDDQQWRVARQNGIGSSQSASILGYGYNTPLQEWERIVSPETAPEMEGDHLVIGKLLERPIAQMYAEKTDRTLWYNGNRIWRHKEYPFITCTPDFVDWENREVVETKNVGIFAASEWQDEEVPLKFQIQTQHQLAITGMDRAVLVGLIGGNQIEYRVIERNERFIKGLLNKLCDFWAEHVLTRTPPPETGIAANLEVYQRLHPHDNGKAKRLQVDPRKVALLERVCKRRRE